MATFHPYLNFNGNTEEAFNFYKSVFGGEFSALMRNKDLPAEYPVPEAAKELIMHISLPLSNGVILMGTDATESMGQKLIPGNNFAISIGTESEAETDKLFNLLSTGGHVTMQLDKTFWGSYFGMLTDQFGIQWMVSYDYPKDGEAHQESANSQQATA